MPFEKMPQLPDSVARIPVREKKHTREDRGVVEEKMKQEGREILGRGVESVVEVHPHNKELAAAHSFNKIEARVVFYNHRILHTLFPNNFPVIHAAFENNPSDEEGEGSIRGGTIRERVNVQKEEKEVAEDTKKLKDISPVSSKDFAYVHQELFKMGVMRQGFENGSGSNFGRDAEGYEKYLDANDVIGYGFIAKRDTVIDYMITHKYSSEDIEKVTASLDRLEVLAAEKQASKITAQAA